tara:strand:- start:6425 stop:7510 length:1086 start_codon:yes stop_codon:yes gene_type:complete
MAKAKQDRTVVANRNTLSSLDPRSKRYKTPTLSAYEATGAFDPLLADERLKEFDRSIKEKGKSFYDVGDVLTSPVAAVKSSLDEESELREQGLPTPLTPYMSDELIDIARFASDFVPSSGEELAEELALNTAFSINWGNKTVRAGNNLVELLKGRKASEVGIEEAEEWAKDLSPLGMIEDLKSEVEFGPEKTAKSAKEALQWAGEEADAQIASVYADHDFLSTHFPEYKLINEDPTKYMGPDSEQFFQLYGAPLIRDTRRRIKIVRDIEENADKYIDYKNLTGEDRLVYDEYLYAREMLEDTLEMTKETLYDVIGGPAGNYTDDVIMEYLERASGANKSEPSKIYKGVDMTAAIRVGLISE